MKFLNDIEKAERLLTNISGLIKGKNGKIEQAVAGEDYATPTNVSDAISSHNSNGGAHSTQFNAKLDKSGGTMTGAITLAGDPTQALHAATKQYVDNNSGGGTLTELVRFTSSGTFNPSTYPSKDNRYLVYMVGGGGGGGEKSGGGAGATVVAPMVIDTSITITIGAGGAGRTGNNYGVNGGNTVVGEFNAPGGIGGLSGLSSTNVYGGAAGSATNKVGGNSSLGTGGESGSVGTGYGSGGGSTAKGKPGIVIIYGWV